MLLLIVVQVQVFFQSGCFPFTFLFPEDSQSVQNRFHRSLKQSVSQRARREIFEKDEMLRKVATRQNVTCMPSMPSLLPILPKSPLSRHPRQNCKSLHVPRQFKRTFPSNIILSRVSSFGVNCQTINSKHSQKSENVDKLKMLIGNCFF